MLSVEADGSVQPSPPGKPLPGAESAGSAVSGKGKGHAGAGSAGAGVSGKGKGGQPPWWTPEHGQQSENVELATLAMKGIVLPTKGTGKGKGQASKPSAPVTLDSVTPTLIRTPPGRVAAGEPSRLLSQPRPQAEAAPAVTSAESVASSSLPRSTQQEANADALSVRLDEILERLQVLEQRSEEILNLLLRASPRLSGLD